MVNTTANQNSPFLTTITGKIILREIVDYPFSLRATLMKCETRVEATCEHYTTTKFADICRFMPQWMKLSNSSDFPTSCPFSVGEYRLNGMQIGNMWRVFPLTESYWKVTARMYKHDKLIGCVINKFEIRKERRKTRL
ncbi:uncharacterized protein LOC111049855 [Nilaparvata lugens]|uniref:uncharacterized protein LOC111049855 n=1 Tax=Nilaparvata lugens TaxID=108931 RepID=UPI00193CA757|nr:uncharacterized protein LOC111049855 [Nilaparvata lugens]